MPIKKAAFKALRQAKKRELQNKKVELNLDFLIRKSRKAIEKGEKAQAEDWVKKTLKALDKTAEKRVIKKNTAARLKSRLQKRLNALRKSSPK